MGPLSYMWSVVYRNVVVWRMTVFRCTVVQCLCCYD